jgi:hypothetical protein
MTLPSKISRKENGMTHDQIEKASYREICEHIHSLYSRTDIEYFAVDLAVLLDSYREKSRLLQKQLNLMQKEYNRVLAELADYDFSLYEKIDDNSLLK